LLKNHDKRGQWPRNVGDGEYDTPSYNIRGGSDTNDKEEKAGRVAELNGEWWYLPPIKTKKPKYTDTYTYNDNPDKKRLDFTVFLTPDKPGIKEWENWVSFSEKAIFRKVGNLKTGWGRKGSSCTKEKYTLVIHFMHQKVYGRRWISPILKGTMCFKDEAVIGLVYSNPMFKEAFIYLQNKPDYDYDTGRHVKYVQYMGQNRRPETPREIRIHQNKAELKEMYDNVNIFWTKHTQKCHWESFYYSVKASIDNNEDKEDLLRFAKLFYERIGLKNAKNLFIEIIKTNNHCDTITHTKSKQQEKVEQIEQEFFKSKPIGSRDTRYIKWNEQSDNDISTAEKSYEYNSSPDTN
jgi:hypothetical protein